MKNTENRVFKGRFYIAGNPPQLVNQAHISPDGQFYQCRPQPKVGSSLIDATLFAQTTDLKFNLLELATGEKNVGLECFSCTLLQITADGQYICGSSGQKLVPVEEAK